MGCHINDSSPVQEAFEIHGFVEGVSYGLSHPDVIQPFPTLVHINDVTHVEILRRLYYDVRCVGQSARSSKRSKDEYVDLAGAYRVEHSARVGNDHKINTIE